MIKLIDYQTKNALPSEMKTVKRNALCFAFDQQKEKYINRIKRVHIWADLENVSDDKLDFLAVENRVLFYDPNLKPEIKRNLIRNSIYWHMKLGTINAMNEIISIYVDDRAKVVEWYKYNGLPYHFNVIIYNNIDNRFSLDEAHKLKENVIRYKNARSRLDIIFYIFQDNLIIVWKNKVNLKKVFFNNIIHNCGKIGLFDGSYEFDGSIQFDSVRGYFPLTITNFLKFEIKECFKQSVIYCNKIRNKSSTSDNEFDFNVVNKLSNKMNMKLNNNFNVSTKESISSSLSINHNEMYFDGEYLFDGEKVFDSYVKEEDL